MADVFISYARQDREWVETLAGEIERAGLTVWWDRQLSYGRSFDAIISAELEAARAVVVVWSATAIQSDWVKDEAQAGRARGVLLPVLKEAVAPPLGFRQSHSANLARWPDEDQREFVKLLSEIGALTGIDLTPPSALHERAPQITVPATPAPRSLRTLTLLGLAVAALSVAAIWFAIDWSGAEAPSAPPAGPAPGPAATASPESPAPPNTASRRPLITLQTAGGRIEGVGISPDGTRVVAVGSEGDGAYLWDAQSGEEIGRLGSIMDKYIAFSADGSRVATARTERIQIWDVRHGTAIASVGSAPGALTGATFSGDGKRVVAIESGDPQLWDVDSSTMIAVLGESDGRGKDAAFSPDGTKIVTADGGSDSARIWNAADGALLGTLEGHDNAVVSAAFSADGSKIVTSSEDGTAIVWEATSGERLGTLGFHGDAVSRALFSPDGARIIAIVADGTMDLWTAGGDRIAKLQGKGSTLIDAVFSPDGAHLIGLDAGGDIYLWNGTNGTAEATLNAATGHGPTALRLSRDGTRLLSARDGTVTIEAITLP